MPAFVAATKRKSQRDLFLALHQQLSLMDDTALLDDRAAFQWRQDFISTLLQCDLPALGLRVQAETLRPFWTTLAHQQGQMFNASALGQAIAG